MKRKRLAMLANGALALALIIGVPFNTLAASPQQNTQQVQKAFEKLKEGLEKNRSLHPIPITVKAKKSKSQYPQSTNGSIHAPARMTAGQGTPPPNNNDNMSKSKVKPINSHLLIDKSAKKVIREHSAIVKPKDNSTTDNSTVKSIVKDNVTIAKPKLLKEIIVPKTKNNVGVNETLPVKSCPRHQDNVSSTPAVVSENIKNIEHRIRTKIPGFHSTAKGIVNGVLVGDSSVTVLHTGNIKYNILTKKNLKYSGVYALDILNPKHIYNSKVQVFMPVLDNATVKRVVSAWHTTLNDLRLYGVPFLRLSIYTKSKSYKITKSGGKLKIVFSKSKSQFNLPKAKVKKSKQGLGTIQTRTKVSYPPISKVIKRKSSSLSFNKMLSHSIQISLKDITRVVAPENVEQVIYSREHHLQVQVIGKNIFIKPLPVKIMMPNGTFIYKYNSEPRDMYIVTSNKIYALNLVPQKIPSITYTLKPSDESTASLLAKYKSLKQSITIFKEGVGASVQLHKANSYVVSLLNLIKSAYNGIIPYGYTFMPYHLEKDYEQVSVKGAYKLVGQYTLYAYKIRAYKNVRLSDGQFMSLINKPLASVVVNPVLSAGGTTMLFVVGGSE